MDNILIFTNSWNEEKVCVLLARWVNFELHSQWSLKRQKHPRVETCLHSVTVQMKTQAREKRLHGCCLIGYTLLI